MWANVIRQGAEVQGRPIGGIATSSRLTFRAVGRSMHWSAVERIARRQQGKETTGKGREERFGGFDLERVRSSGGGSKVGRRNEGSSNDRSGDRRERGGERRGSASMTKESDRTAASGRPSFKRTDWTRTRKTSPSTSPNKEKRPNVDHSSSSSSRGAPSGAQQPQQRQKAKTRTIRPQRIIVSLPAVIAVSSLARVMDVNMRRLQHVMSQAGYQDTRPDLMLTYADAELLAMEFNINATPLSSASADFDLFPRAPAADISSVPLRPPVVAIMGHVDHGKTTLLDTLRSASVAAGEAGGITQHVGAFSVEVAGLSSTSNERKSITFLDTPGHAAFTQMRSRGAKVTDIVVLVVAADDGVMPQTKEVINMVRQVQEEESGGNGSSLRLIVAISKIDRSDADPAKVKGQLMGENVLLEEFGGDVPCVEISGKTGEGLDVLQDTLVAVSELNEVRAERDGPAEGYVIESRVQKGFGNTAIVLVKRGTLKVGEYCVAGTGWCKVRRMTDSSGQVDIEQAMPGEAVMLTGWRSLPSAGDLVLGVVDGADGQSAEDQAKRSVETRKRVEERRKMAHDLEAINEGRREDAQVRSEASKREREIRQRQYAARQRGEDYSRTAIEQALLNERPALSSEETKEGSATTSKRELRLIVKADVSGTVEAVVGAISSIGNDEVGVKIISTGVGEPSEGDLAMAKAVEGHILCFNVQAAQGLRSSAQKSVPPVEVHCDDVIYRLMSYVTERCAALLPPTLENRVVGEASIQQVFSINVRAKETRNIAGCRVTNGTISRHQMIRVLRPPAHIRKSDENVRLDNAGRQILYEGKLDSLKQVKKEVDEMRKGTECGMSFADNFQDFTTNDVIQSYYVEQVARTL